MFYLLVNEDNNAAKSQKQQKLFGMVRAYQKGELSSDKASPLIKKLANSIPKQGVKDYASTSHKNLPVSKEMKLKEILKSITETEYDVSKFKQIEGKDFDTVLQENNGLPFDQKEYLIFNEKQKNFAGFGKTKFIIKKDKNEIWAEVYSDGYSKVYVFKKLLDNTHTNYYNYGCFIQLTDIQNKNETILYSLSTGFENMDNEKTKILADFIDRINSYSL